MRFWKLRQGDGGLERDIRKSKPTARPEFVASLAQRVTGGRHLSRPRVAIALAGTIAVAGALAAFGGVGYASGGAGAALSGVQQVLTLKGGGSVSSTPSTDQYNIGPCTLGYPDGSNPPRSQAVFSESTVLKGFSIVGSNGTTGIAAWYSDEHALLLGLDPGVTPFVVQDAATKTAHASNPSVGDTSKADAEGRPFYPAAFVTKITPPNQTGRQGDWQQPLNNPVAGNPNPLAQKPQDLFGTWKSASQGTNIGSQNDPATNNSFGPGADTPPAGLQFEKYRTEVRWNLFNLKDQNGQPITGGNAYRIEFMVHDGDQNKAGGDVGEACVNVTIAG